MSSTRAILRNAIAGALGAVLGVQHADARPRDRVDRSSQPAGANAAGFTVQSGLVYRTVGSHELMLDLYVPAPAGQPAPVAVYIHGGGWTKGSRRMGRIFCEPLARAGYLTASIDYRLAGDTGWPAQIEDCQAAVQWLQAYAAEYGGDPRQVVVTGGSAGGQLALSLACGWGEDWPDNPIRACCSWYGPTDMSLLDPTPRVSRNLRLYLGQTPQARAANGAAASALLHVDAGDPPVLLIHGTKDPVVPIDQSRLIYAALRKAGVATELIEVPGGSHGALLAPPDEMQRLAQRMIDWFDAQLAR
jgi:acetyl esterase/lipase